VFHWAWLRGLRPKGAFRADLQHQIAGPFASFIPLIGILLSAHGRTTLIELATEGRALAKRATAVLNSEVFASRAAGTRTWTS
jgi:tellurite resistance protein